jgi:hypothetical protein
MQKEARMKHDVKRRNQKEYADKHRRAKEKTVLVGDEVLLKQEKTTTKPPWDPKPYKVVEVKGTKITAVRGHKERTRNVEKMKVLKKRINQLKNKKTKATEMERTGENGQQLEREVSMGGAEERFKTPDNTPDTSGQDLEEEQGQSEQGQPRAAPTSSLAPVPHIWLASQAQGARPPTPGEKEDDDDTWMQIANAGSRMNPGRINPDRITIKRHYNTKRENRRYEDVHVLEEAAGRRASW